MKQYIKNGKIPIVIVLLAMIVHAIADSIAVTALFNLHALEIILAGILLSVIVGFSFQTFLDTANLIRKSFKEPVRYENDIHKVHQTAIKVKKDGLLSLNKDILKEEDSFLRDALILLNDYKKPEAIRDVMEKDIESRRANLFRSYNLLKVVSYVAPSFGLIGTLVGMIGLLSHLDQSHAIMQHMATALVSTLYGSLIASFIAVPLMVRIKEYNEKIILRYQIVMEGILMIATNDSTRNVFDKMNVMLDEEDRLDYPGTKDNERNIFQYGSQV
ncbi:chemotaxis protein MotA [Tindallia magadiensis]|uniref:Chemotaxis protein MotA n=1 Tax=Tindallia magadiensis TaxID=69895 RepID=A0A1I3DU22_9FIRM|nr:MotA/TolQ/ExbB proton channel family protein [Tindallia magadiensis]SFH90195.1 chemotaxis protein MotA [Tindallia magadiensis]